MGVEWGGGVGADSGPVPVEEVHVQGGVKDLMGTGWPQCGWHRLPAEGVVKGWRQGPGLCPVELGWPKARPQLSLATCEVQGSEPPHVFRVPPPRMHHPQIPFTRDSLPHT